MANACSLVDRVLADALFGVLAQRTVNRLVVAYSGGMDSSLLLHAVKQWQQAHRPDIGVQAVHVHHGLSPNADDWAGFCQQQCQQSGISCDIQRVTLTPDGNGVEQAARQARYRVFDSLCGNGDLLLMGHHGDDQLETRLMRLTRGSGLTGLVGIPLGRPLDSLDGAYLLRPFLSLRRRELACYAEAKELQWIDDESNQALEFERNWWRQSLLPQIETRFPGRLDAMLASTEALRSDAEALSYLVQPHLEACVQVCNWPFIQPQTLSITAVKQRPECLQSTLIRTWLVNQGVQAPTMKQLEQLIQHVMAAADDAVPELRSGNCWIRRYRDELLVCHEIPAGVMAARTITVADDRDRQRWTEVNTDSVRWAGRCWKMNQVAAGEYQLTSLALLSEPYRLTLKPSSRPTKRLKQLWQEAGVPPWLRSIWPLLFQQGELRAIPGVAVDGRNQRVE